ncbi:MAG TPA: hypothetical protein ENJ50_04300 [Planctomycetaceae bacterium]|nr:hypothetical protein [Planctomycetaceae bacterium]
MQRSLQTGFGDLLGRVGILADPGSVPAHLSLFVEQADRAMAEVVELVAKGEWDEERGYAFQQLLLDVSARIMCHPIIASNLYLRRFAQGVTEAQARHECQQFSVFALQFDVAQAKLVANAPTRESYEERLRVLLNEKGIPYEDGFEGELTGRWNEATVHFTWMQNMARGLGLNFEDIGKIWVGLPGTKAFVQATFDLYGSTDPSTAAGATFAIENWAANALWKPWIAGMEKLNNERRDKVDLGYLLYHDKEEEHHSQATIDELLEDFSEPWFDLETFLTSAERMLTEGVQAYYESQLDTLPEKDETWPMEATDPRRFDPASIPRLSETGSTAQSASQ